jgi:hypothetical protein
VWRLTLEGGSVRRVEEPALRVPPGHVAVRVKAFLIDDFSLWALRRGSGPFSRWAFGVVVSGGEVGRYVVAYAENAAAQYVASDRFVYVDGSNPSALETAAVAYVVEALGRVPRMRKVEVLGDDPRGAAVARLAEVGPSRWRVALQGAVVGGGAAVAVSRLVEVAGNAVVRFVDVPSRWALRRAVELRIRLGLPALRELSFGGWGVVVVE